ncbi:MAG: hypothetical protein ACRDCE_16465 [Cetobacterium sp.]|uniref:hypothetical protein n=1 Tax=Cetobacterium sp. TaxID=2071632 RepID=UPI003EE5FCDD
MKISIEMKVEKITSEFIGRDEKKILMLYEALGKDICKRYGFDYTKLLEMMLIREEKRKG